jgi:hypothetical protein
MGRGQSHGRITSPGSQLYLQEIVNNKPKYVNYLILRKSPSLVQYALEDPHWVSPLAKKNYEEYADDRFLQAISQARLYRQLRQFWPAGGPQWDALAIVKGKDGSSGVILAEAKANIPESGDPVYACRAMGKSRQKIENSLALIKKDLGAKPDADWMGDYYQYANRLAYLYFLHIMCNVSTWLVFIYFVGGKKVTSPRSIKEWRRRIRQIQKALGLPKNHLLTERIVEIFPEVKPFS